MTFLSPEVALFLYKSIIAHVWNTVAMSALVPLTATWNCWTNYENEYIYRTFGPSLAASLEPLVHSKCGQLKSFPYVLLGRHSSELAQLVPLPFSLGRSTCYSDRLHNFSVSIARCYKDVYVNSSFPSTAKLWNLLPMECFPLTY